MILGQLFVPALLGWSVHGVVWRADASLPVVGATVEVAGTRVSTVSDAHGVYTLSQLPCDPCHLHVSAPGYEVADVDVARGSASSLALDVALVPQPRHLPAIVVTGRDGDVVTGGSAMRDVGARSYSIADIEHSPFGVTPDPLGVTAASGDVAALPDVGTALHVRGGDADETLVLLDGVPVYAPYHANGVLSAVPAEFVEGVTVEAGVPPARYGGALAATVLMESRQVPEGSVATQGALDMNAIRESVAASLPGGGATFVGELRQSTGALMFRDIDDGDNARGFGDAVGKLTVALPLGTLEMLAFGTRDHVRFDANTDSVGVPETGPSNAFRWGAASTGLIWRAGIGAARVTMRAWSAEATTRIGWSGVALENALHDLGASGEVQDGAWTLGASVDRSATAYRVASPDAPVLVLAAAPVTLATFIEGRWTLWHRLNVTAGTRAEVVPGVAATLEPRVSLRYALTSSTTLALGAARTAQVVQSLANGESVLDAVVPLSLPMAASRGGVPVARADQLTASVEHHIGSRLTFVVDGYARRMDGLALVAPVTALPFATTFDRGTGTASGVVGHLEYRWGDRLRAQIAYALSGADREAGGVRYTPSFETPRSATTGIAYRVWRGTTLDAALWFASPRPTSILANDIQWTSVAPLGGAGDLEGTPDRIVGTLDGERLPAYERLDLGVTERFRPRLFGFGAELTARVRVTDVLNHPNPAGAMVVPGDGAALQPLLLPARAVVASLGWSL